MNASNCIGWPAHPHCNAWGRRSLFHGCKYDAKRHPAFPHECRCGHLHDDQGPERAA